MKIDGLMMLDAAIQQLKADGWELSPWAFAIENSHSYRARDAGTDYFTLGLRMTCHAPRASDEEREAITEINAKYRVRGH
jgi:hypothetical protein